MSDSVRPHRRQPIRLPCPWDSPGKNTGVGCHFFFQCMKVKSESEVAQSCPTQQPHGLQPTRLCRPWDFPGKSTGVGCHRLLHLGSLSIHKCENICNLIHVSIFIFSEQDNLWPNLKKEKASLVAQMVKNLPEIQEIWV